jgi:hypothetical protein
MRLHRAAERVRADIVRLAHAGLDSISLRREAATRMLRAVPAVSYGFGTLDPSTLLLTSTVRENIPDEVVPHFVKNEYAEDDYNKLADLAARRLLVGRLSAETEGELARSRRYRRILAPLGWGDEMRALFVSGHSCWG